jgi:1,2-dihydroxy-3-keto-5-methylthiopentene dioxygenase
MTLLTVWADDDPDTVLTQTSDGDAIADELKQHGVRFERWPVVEDLPARPTSDEVLAAYEPYVRRVVENEGYILVDALYMTPEDTEEWQAKAGEARQKFLSEHTHDDDEDRFFARGAGVFYLHVRAKVYGVLCEAGDLLSVPANTTHWFDMGTRPDYVAIRFFHDEDGWVGNFTGARLADSFADFDTLMSQRRG